MDVINAAIQSSPQLVKAWSEIGEQAAMVGVAKGALLPSANVVVTRMRTVTNYASNAMPTTAESGNTLNGGVDWKIFDFGMRDSQIRSAQDLLLAAQHDKDATLQKTILDSAQAYFNAQTSIAIESAKEEECAVAERTVDSAKRREVSGAGAHADTLQAEASLERARMELARSRGDVVKSLAMIKFLLGLNQVANVQLEVLDVSPSDDMVEHTYVLDAQLGEWMRTAEQNHPAIAAARAQWAASREAVTATRLEGFPSLALNGNIYRNGYPNQGLSSSNSRVSTIGLTLSIPLFDGFAHQYRVRQAQAQADQRAADSTLTERQTLMAVVNSYSDAISAIADFRSTSLLLKAAGESYKATKRKYDNGAASILEILNSQKLLAESRIERVRAINAWEVARIQLVCSAGSLTAINVQARIAHIAD